MREYTVYKLVNRDNGKPFYIGVSTSPKQRFLEHKTKRGINLEKDAVIDSCSEFDLVHLETTYSKEAAELIESKYIKYYGDCFELTNIQSGGFNPPSQKGVVQSKETKHKRSVNSPKRKIVVQLSKQGKVVGVFHSVREAGRQTGIDHRSIQQVAAGSKVRKTAGGYKWKYKD